METMTRVWNRTILGPPPPTWEGSTNKGRYRLYAGSLWQEVARQEAYVGALAAAQRLKDMAAT